jgi:acyl carrier protein
MDKNVFISKFVDQLEDYNGPEINLETRFRDIEDWDSLTGIAVQIMAADDFGSNIPDAEFINAETVGDLWDLTVKFKK